MRGRPAEFSTSAHVGRKMSFVYAPRCIVVAGSCFATVTSTVCALSAEPEGPVVWYRSSEGCPDGAAFLARLRSRAQGARLARVNDRIDFVVTLGTSGGRSSGKLEFKRQLTVHDLCWPSPHGCARYLERPGCDGSIVLSKTGRPATHPTGGTGSVGSGGTGNTGTGGAAGSGVVPERPFCSIRVQ